MNEFSLSTYGPSEVQFAPRLPSVLPANFLNETLINLAQKDKSTIQWMTKQNQPKIGSKFLKCDDGFGFYYFENGSEDTTLQVEISLPKCKGYLIRKPHLNLISYSPSIQRKKRYQNKNWSKGDKTCSIHSDRSSSKHSILFEYLYNSTSRKGIKDYQQWERCWDLCMLLSR